MKKSITMGATDRTKASKRATKAGKSFQRFFSIHNKSEESGSGNVRLDLDASEPPSSSALSASSTSVLPSSTTADITPNASSNMASTVASTPTKAIIGTKVDTPTAAGAAQNLSDPELEPSKRVKTVIIVDNKAVAVQMRSDKEPEIAAKEDVLMPIVRAFKPKPRLSLQLAEVPERTGIRTFRMWAPQQQRGITVSVGNRASRDESDRIFGTREIKARSYNDWRKEAKAMLPSNTGGPPIEELTDVLDAAPSLKREGDPRAIQKTIRRLSIDSDEKKKMPPRPRTHKVKVDYTKPREINWEKSKDDKKDDSDTDTILDLGDSDEEDEARREEWERQQAGIDIKGKISTLRQLTDHLSMKRQIRHQLVGKATGHTILDTEEIPIKEHILYAIENIGDLFHDLFSFFLIWEKHIKEINGRFGVVTANYFSWVRQMVGLEMLAFFLTTAIVIIPQMVDQGPHRHDAPGSDPAFQIQDVITGEGFFHHSYLYYTGYEQSSNPATESNPMRSPAFRFLFCLLVMFLILTYFIFSRLTKYYQTARMESAVAGVANMDNFKAIFCGWDFSCRNEQAKIFLHRTITREMRILAKKSKQPKRIAYIQIEAERKKLLGFAVKHMGLFWGPWTVHISGNLLIIIICVLLGVFLYHLCKLKLYYYLNCVSFRDDGKQRKLHHPYLCPNGDEYLSTWILSFPAIFASMATLLLTKFILVIGDIEIWATPERKIYATMIRAGLFNFTNIVVFYSFWLTAKPELNRNGFVAETIFGKELYRLVVIQGLVDLGLTLGVQGLYHLICRKSKNYQKPEFRTEYCCLSMFFIFSVSRIGTLFCPPLSLFVIIRLIGDFYLNKFSLFHLSSIQSFSVHVSQVYAPFLLTFFILCYLITSFMNVYYVSETIPSNYDGPFERYNKSYDEVLGLLLSSGENTRWIGYLGEEAFLLIFLAILGAALYFCYNWAGAYKPLVVQLNELITMERADRDLLLKAIFEIGKVTADDDKGSRALSRMRRAGLLATQGQFEKTGEEGYSQDEDGEFEDDHDHADSQIDALIRHVRKRKSKTHDVHLPTTGRHSIEHGQHRHSASKKGTLTTAFEDMARQTHIDHMEAIVANIVDARRRRSLTMGHYGPQSTMLNHDTASIMPSEQAASHQHDNVGLPHEPEQQHHPQPPHAPGKVVGHHEPEQQHHPPHPPHAPGKIVGHHIPDPLHPGHPSAPHHPPLKVVGHHSNSGAHAHRSRAGWGQYKRKGEGHN